MIRSQSLIHHSPIHSQSLIHHSLRRWWSQEAAAVSTEHLSFPPGTTPLWMLWCFTSLVILKALKIFFVKDKVPPIVKTQTMIVYQRHWNLYKKPYSVFKQYKLKIAKKCSLDECEISRVSSFTISTTNPILSIVYCNGLISKKS